MKFSFFLLVSSLTFCLSEKKIYATEKTLQKIKNIVIIYAENRSFDNLYGTFPGANGLINLPETSYQQIDFDGRVLQKLPPVWGGITRFVNEKDTLNLPNRPFRIDDPKKFKQSLRVATRDLSHTFFRHQMQINEGKNNRFVNASDAGALPMGHYEGSAQKMWKKAQSFTLADNFFAAAFGGSFLNHFWLICACTPIYPNANVSPAKDFIASPGGDDGVTLLLDLEANIRSILQNDFKGPPSYLGDGSITPINKRFDQFYMVNTMQPPYQPSIYPNTIGKKTAPPQTMQTIGDLLSEHEVSWAWFSGAWNQALIDPTIIENSAPDSPDFQTHHQPFNYFSSFAPGTTKRSEHLKDYEDMLEAIKNGTLPQVSFYKPQGSLSEHPRLANVFSGDEHISELIDRLMNSPQWEDMFIIVTYDEHGGWWDHVSPPKGDHFGPGQRIPAIFISPFVKKGFVDHTLYDTTSIARFLTKKFNLPSLPGLISRQEAIIKNGNVPLGDLTNTLIDDDI